MKPEEDMSCAWTDPWEDTDDQTCEASQDCMAEKQMSGKLTEVDAVYEDGTTGRELMDVPDMEQYAMNMDAMGKMVRAMISPVLEQFGAVLEKTNQAIERIAASNQLMNERIGELERQVRIQKPVSKSQEKYIGDAIRARARELLDGKGCEDRKAVNRLAGVIRKTVMARYGIGSLREVPAYDYETAMEQARRWNDPLVLREVIKATKQSEQS